ncbi:MAG: thermonuclease family protein [Mesorhizobium sp.]|nr:thermonuclease family protein [Mesorhizobium sp.]
MCDCGSFSWRGLPQEFAPRPVLPHGQQHRLGSLPLRLALSVAAFLFSALGASPDDVVVGRASVIDGDTIEISGERIRLDGIDAPESWQTCRDGRGAWYRCGVVSAQALDEFLAQSRPTRCRRTSRDRYGRAVAICTRADGAEVGSWLVTRGYALDWPKYSEGRYARQQETARATGSGMWAGSFVEPWKARKR